MKTPKGIAATLACVREGKTSVVNFVTSGLLLNSARSSCTGSMYVSGSGSFGCGSLPVVPYFFRSLV